MVFFAKPSKQEGRPDAKNSGRRASEAAAVKKGQGRTPVAAAPAPGATPPPASRKKQQLAAAAKEGRDNTRILQKALAAAHQQPAAGGAATIPAHNPLQDSAACVGGGSVQAYSEGRPSPGQLGSVSSPPHAAATLHVPRHMRSSLSELLGGPQLPQAEPPRQRVPPAEPPPPPPPGWSAALSRADSLPEAQQPWARQQQRQLAAAPAASPSPPPTNYMQRNSQRLGGQGVASLLTDASPPAVASSGAASGARGAALADLKAGLTADQKRQQAAAREALRRDLEEQMRAKKEADARRKAQLQEQEEREDAALRAFYARQAQAAAEEATASSTSGGMTARGGGSTARGAAGEVGRAHSEIGSAAAGVVVMVPGEKTGNRASLEGGPAVQQQQQQHVPSLALHALAAASNPAAGEPQPLPYAAVPGLAQSPGLPLVLPSLAQLPPAAGQLAAMYSPFPGHPLAVAPGQLPVLPFNPYLAMMPAAQPAAATDGSTVQLAGMLKDLQAEQSRLRDQFAAQSCTVAQLQTDIMQARRERDAARQQLERVQGLLAGSGSGSRIPLPPAVAGSPVAGHAAGLDGPYSPGLNLDTLAVSMVLPASAGYASSGAGQLPHHHHQQVRPGGGRPGAPGTAVKGLRPVAGAAASSRKAGAAAGPSSAAQGKGARPKGWA